MQISAMKTNLIQLSAIASLALAGSLIAADPVPAPPYPPLSPSSSSEAGSTGAVAFQGKITTVNREAKTVTIEDSTGKIQTLHIGETTRLSRGESESASWDDLKVGAEIRGMQKAQGSMSHAETVTISSEAK